LGNDFAFSAEFNMLKKYDRSEQLTAGQQKQLVPKQQVRDGGEWDHRGPVRADVQKGYLRQLGGVPDHTGRSRLA